MRPVVETINLYRKQTGCFLQEPYDKRTTQREQTHQGFSKGSCGAEVERLTSDWRVAGLAPCPRVKLSLGKTLNPKWLLVVTGYKPCMDKCDCAALWAIKFHCDQLWIYFQSFSSDHYDDAVFSQHQQTRVVF